LVPEFQVHALTIYMQTFNAVSDISEELEFYGESNYLEACAHLASNHFSLRKNGDLNKLADFLMERKQSITDQDKFTESLNTVVTFLLRTKDFDRADTIIAKLGLPSDPAVCLT
jgi:hypothetical protein